MIVVRKGVRCSKSNVFGNAMMAWESRHSGLQRKPLSIGPITRGLPWSWPAHVGRR